MIDNKLTEYAFLPNGAYPLDARSHFENLKEIQWTLSRTGISYVEGSPRDWDGAKFYVGQLITTSNAEVWQINNVSSANVMLYVKSTAIEEVYWGSTDVKPITTLRFNYRKVGSYMLQTKKNNSIDEWIDIELLSTKEETIKGELYIVGIFSTFVKPVGGGGGAAQIQSDWNQTDTQKPDFIKNKPTIITPVQSDWDQEDRAALSFILNKPQSTGDDETLTLGV